MKSSALRSVLNSKTMTYLLVIWAVTSIGAFWLWNQSLLQCAQVPPTATAHGYDVCGREWPAEQRAVFIGLLFVSAATSIAILVRAVRAARSRRAGQP